MTQVKTEQPLSAQPVDYQNDPRLSRETRAFLAALNSPAPPALEKLSPAEAREVLVGAQTSVKVDLSGIEESEKTISADGFSLKLNIVRPEGAKGNLPVFIFIHSPASLLPL